MHQLREIRGHETTQPRSIAAACAQLFALLAATTVASDAQTWHWTYVTRTADSPPVTAQSTVAISAMPYTWHTPSRLQNRQIVIESCAADLRDIEDASTIRTQGAIFLLIRFKPSRSAACPPESGPR